VKLHRQRSFDEIVFGDLNVVLGECLEQCGPGEFGRMVEGGVASEHLVDAVLDVGWADVTGRDVDVFAGVLGQGRSVIAVPDRAKTVTRTARPEIGALAAGVRRPSLVCAERLTLTLNISGEESPKTIMIVFGAFGSRASRSRISRFTLSRSSTKANTRWTSI
jgi:hypothetical protein